MRAPSPFSAPEILRAHRVLAGETITEAEARVLIRVKEPYTGDLYALANKTRHAFSGPFFPCSITNAKSGNCGEDCSFCAQSRHNSASANVYPLRADEAIIEDAQRMKAIGAKAFSIVTSGGGYLHPTNELKRICALASRIKRELDIETHVSLGVLSDDALALLAEAGVSTIHHNIETAPSYYPKVCSTHSIEQRIETARRITANGFRLCSGGIIGLGESEDERAEFIFALTALTPDTIPINIHQKIEGTRAPACALSVREILNAIAVMRLAHPRATITLAAGRETFLADYQGLALRAGANGMIIGGYLTTDGRNAHDDMRLINSLDA